MGDVKRRSAGLVLSVIAMAALTVACTPRTEIPSTNPTELNPDEKSAGKPCGFGFSDNCGNHHNNNRGRNNKSGNNSRGGSNNNSGGGGGHHGGGGHRGGK